MKKIPFAFIAALALVIFWRPVLLLLILCLIAGSLLGLSKIAWAVAGGVQKASFWFDDAFDQKPSNRQQPRNAQQEYQYPKDWAEYEVELQALQQAADRLREAGERLNKKPN